MRNPKSSTIKEEQNLEQTLPPKKDLSKHYISKIEGFQEKVSCLIYGMGGRSQTMTVTEIRDVNNGPF